MAQRDKASFTSQIASAFADNTSGAITAAIVRGYLTDQNDSYANVTSTTGAGQVLVSTATDGVLEPSSITEGATEVDIDKPCVFRPIVNIGSTSLRVLGDLTYQSSTRDFAPVNTPFDTNGTSNPMYVKLGAVEVLPAGANQTDRSETLALTAGQSMTFVQPGATGAQHISRQFVIDLAVAGDVRLEIFVGTDATGRKIVDQRFTGLTTGENTLVFETFPRITPTTNYFIRYTAITNVTIRGATISTVFVPYNVTSGWPYSEVRILSEEDGAFIADLLEALTGDDRLDYNALKNLPGIPQAAPSITAFSIQGQSATVDAPFTLSGNQTFEFVVENPANVQGNLTLLQETTQLSNLVDPTETSVGATVTSVTLNAGESVTFTLEGTSALSGNPTFQRKFTITARTAQDFVYISAEADSDPSDVDTGAATAVAFQSGNQDLTIPTFTGNAFLTILQRASDPEITQILIGGLNQFGTFTKTDDAITVGGALYDAYVTTNQVVGAALSGQTITLVR